MPQRFLPHITHYIIYMDLTPLFQEIRSASRDLLLLKADDINRVLRSVADAIENNMDMLLSANRMDLERMDKSNPKYDRLQLTPSRLEGIATDMRNVASLPNPLGKVLLEKTLPNGLQLQKTVVPFGVIGVIYEARPNVSFDVFSLCLKSGSACVLKGGSDAESSNRAIVSLIEKVLTDEGLNPRLVTLLPSDREATTALLHARGWVEIGRAHV